MSRFGFFSVIAILSLLALDAGSLHANDVPGPEDDNVIKASRDAVERLGPRRGALAIEGKVVDIVGLKSIQYKEKSVSLEQTLSDLGARVEGDEIRVSLSGDVLFAFDKWDIMPEAEATLMKLAKAIKKFGKSRIIIEGHTDSKGSNSYNLSLSQKRAESVKKWFLKRGNLKKVNFQVTGYGEAKPVARNTHPDGSDNPEGRAKNRRVEIRIKK